MNCPKCDAKMLEENRFFDAGSKENIKQIEETVFVCVKCKHEINKGELEEIEE